MHCNYQSEIVEPAIFTRAKPSQHGSNIDLLELSRAKKLKSDIKRAELIQEGSKLWSYFMVGVPTLTYLSNITYLLIA